MKYLICSLFQADELKGEDFNSPEVFEVRLITDSKAIADHVAEARSWFVFPVQDGEQE